MTQAASVVSANHWEWTSAPDEVYEDDSPFGVQGLVRGTLQIIKPDCINRLAIALALSATKKELQDPAYVNQVLSQHPDWTDQYQVVHLIEKSLWIQGQSKLVITMTRNPKQIPDNPPAKVKRALARARTLHPQATIWYGVPLFSEKANSDGLPIPLTATEVRVEARRRVHAAVEIAVRSGWKYRTAMTIARIPLMCWQGILLVHNWLQRVEQGMAEAWKECHKDVRTRRRAIYVAEWERSRYGYSEMEIPEHRNMLSQILESAFVFLERTSAHMADAAPAYSLLSALGATIVLIKFSPMIFISISMVSCDPFLFVELPEEPGKLRHIGHWYWQDQDGGQQKLHLHV